MKKVAFIIDLKDLCILNHYYKKIFCELTFVLIRIHSDLDPSQLPWPSELGMISLSDHFC